MKVTYRYATGLVALSLVLPAAADVIYSNMQDILIPADYDGVYLDVDGPNGWNTNMFSPVAGWDINPFFGGSVLANSPEFQPVRSGTGNLASVLNLAVGSSIGPGSVFSTFTWDDDANPLTPAVPGYGGSQDHLAASAGAGKFVIGQEGYFGFRLNNSKYGWMRVVFTNNTGGGMIKDWAYDNSGASIVIGRVEQSAPSNNTQLVTLAPVTGEVYTLGSVISNTGGNVNSVLKTGAGTTTLTGTNTYTGVTTVSEGKLLVSTVPTPAPVRSAWPPGPPSVAPAPSPGRSTSPACLHRGPPWRLWPRPN